MRLRPALVAIVPLLAACGAAPSDGDLASDESNVVITDPMPSLHPELRGLLANPGFDGQPMKGVYFFAGEQGSNTNLYTAHPTIPDDEHWNSDPTSRGRVIDRLVATHANVLVMSYWSNMPQWSPMQLDATSVPGVLSASVGKPIVIMPVLEQGIDTGHLNIPHWMFQQDFPQSNGSLAPGLLSRIDDLVTLFQGHMSQWAEMYDRDGRRRYAIHVLHVAADSVPVVTGKSPDEVFAEAFTAVANVVSQKHHIDIGFTLDAIPDPGGYTPSPRAAGPWLEKQPAVLAIQGYASEVFSGKIINGPQGGAPYDNNVSNLYNIVDWKTAALHDWIATNVPVIYDVSSGFDGRFVWQAQGAGFWGDNMSYTEDRWRNALSQFKGNGIKGITFNTWNGYTEGYAAAPTREHRTTINDWLTDLYEPDPRVCSHMEYAGGQRTHRVFGAICEKWVALGGDRGMLGAPATDEQASARGRVSHFAMGSVFWSGATGAHEVHGLIRDAYRNVGYDASCLGLPVSDEEAYGAGRISRFERGVITWYQGDAIGRVACN